MTPARLAWLGAALLALAAAAVPFAARLAVDNRIELWIDPRGEVAADYARFRRSFGSDEIAIVAYEGREIFAADALRAQLEALERLETLAHVTQVSGVPALWRERFEPEPARLRDELLATPFYKRLLVSDDGRVAGLFVETELPARPEARRELARGIEAAAAPLREHGFAVHLVGPPVLNAALDEISEREALRTFPLAAALSIAALFAALRCWRATLAASACGGIAILLTLGAMGAAGRSLNMISSALPSLLWVLGLAGMVHLVWRYQEERRTQACEAALAAALRETALPSTVAALTTALGFLSLLSAGMRPVREFGAFAALGMCFSLAVNLGVGPLLLRGLRVPAPRRPAGRSLVGVERITALSLRRPRAVLAGGGVFLLGCALLLPRIRIESDPLAFLPRDAVLVQAYTAVSERLTGYYSLEVVVETPRGWLDPEAWPALDRVQQRLAALPGVARVLSPVDFLRQLEHGREDGASAGYALPADGWRMRRLTELFDSNGGAGAFHLVSADGRSVRLSALVRVMASSRFLEVVDAARAALAELPAGFSGYATGLVLQLVDAQLALVDTQLASFGLAFLTVFPCILVGLRSLRLTALAIPPNVVPVLPVFALMALADIPLDPATVMVASLALGIAVDDTVHTLATWRRARARGLAAAPAVRAAYADVGPAMVTTAVAACIGFFSVMRSVFVPICFFGLLAGTAMLVALLADLLLLPALLVLFGGRQEPAR